MKLFEHARVYFSGSIKGTPEPDPEFAWKIVSFMKENGADVLSEHVAARSEEERIKIFLAKTKDFDLKGLQPWEITRKVDLTWVEQATYLIALVNGNSLGVGTELQHAVLKPRLGLNNTPILCLRTAGTLDTLSHMVRGITIEKNQRFSIVEYRNIEDARKSITEFLTMK